MKERESPCDCHRVTTKACVVFLAYLSDLAEKNTGALFVLFLFICLFSFVKADIPDIFGLVL